MASIFQDLGLVETVLGDLASFAAGQAVTSPNVKVGADSYNVSIQHLPNGPAAPFAVISGSFFSVLGEALTLGAELAAGAPASLAIKEGNTWYGATLTRAA